MQILKIFFHGIEFDVKLEESSLTSCHIICIFDDEEIEKIKIISQKINEVRLLVDKDDSYTIEEFENILYKIGISVILIAHQKTGFDSIESKQTTHHSLSECVENPKEWIKTGYINALEYQKPKVQGILKNNLKDIKQKFATITGSDCHVWEAYPKKDERQTFNENYITKIKSLPTFKGLVLALTSPDTRFDRKDEGSIQSYIESIKVDNIDYKLSTGINAIIGENGSGKTFLLNKLNNDIPNYYKKIDDVNNVKITKTGEPNITIIKQGSIIEKVKNGKLLDNNSEFYENIPTLNEFKNNIRNFVTNLKNYILNNIKQNEEETLLKDKTISIKEFVDIQNYYVSLNVDIEPLPNNPKERKQNIEKAYKFLLNEYNTNQDFYNNKKKTYIETILTSLQALISTISQEVEIIDNKNKVINIITSVFNDNTQKIRKERSSQENEKEEYLKEIRNFATIIRNYLVIDKRNTSYPIFPKAIDGTSVKSKLGFNFIKEAKYHNLNLEEPLYKVIFTQSYQTVEKIKKILTKEDFTKAVTNATEFEKIDEKLNQNVEKFITEYTKEETRIKTENGTDEIGTTPRRDSFNILPIKLIRES